MKTILSSLRMLAALTMVTGILYPLLVTGVGQVFFPAAATGSLLSRDGQVIGSALLAQKTEQPTYFWPRPSAGDFATVASSASNLGPTNAALKTAIAERRQRLGADAPADLLTSSSSGLDPHISPKSAAFQVPRVAIARGISPAEIQQLVASYTRAPQFGLLGEPTVNVLQLNLALDERFPVKKQP